MLCASLRIFGRMLLIELLSQLHRIDNELKRDPINLGESRNSSVNRTTCGTTWY